MPPQNGIHDAVPAAFTAERFRLNVEYVGKIGLNTVHSIRRPVLLRSGGFSGYGGFILLSCRIQGIVDGPHFRNDQDASLLRVGVQALEFLFCSILPVGDAVKIG